MQHLDTFGCWVERLDDECRVLIEVAGLSEALEATNSELEPQGLYLTHIWGPEQQILTPEWRANCRPVSISRAKRLSVSTLGPVDLILTKMARADEGDLADMKWLLARERLDSTTVRNALSRALVPDVLAEQFVMARERVERLLT